MSDDRTEEQRQQDRALVLALRTASWELEDVAHNLPAGRVTSEDWRDLLTKLDYLRDLVRARCGDTSGPAIERHGTPETD